MLKLIFGASGAGKTTYVYNRIKQDLLAGAQVLLIVPDQEAVTAESALADITSHSSSLKLQIYSFSRLCNSAFRRYGGLSYNYADKSTGKLLLFIALSNLSPMLREYGSIRISDATALESLYATVTELKQCGITPAALSCACEEIQREDSVPEKLKNKLGDVSLLYSAYCTLVSCAFTDPHDDLAKLDELLCEHVMFAGCAVYIDSFHFFTPAQYKILYHIIKTADSTTLTLCAPAVRDKSNPDYVMNTVYDTLRAVEKTAARAGAKIATEELVPGVRFSSDELRFAEGGLRSGAPTQYTKKPEHIRLYRKSTVFEEAEFVACDIARKIRQGKRYRDIGVVVRSADAYRGIIDSVFEKYGIPAFMSVRTDIKEKALVKLILAAFEIHISGFLREDVISYIKTGLVSITREESELFEDYTKKWSISTSSFTDGLAWEMSPYGYGDEQGKEGSRLLEIINATKFKIITPLYDFSQKLAQPENTAVQISSYLYDFLNKTDVRGALAAKRKDAVAFNDPEEAAELVQLWGAVFASIRDLCDVCGDMPLNARQYSELLSMVLSEVDIGKIPTSADAVIIGEAPTLRFGDITDVYLMGVNEGVFPAAAVNRTVFGDTDKAILSDYSIALSEDSTQCAYREMFYFYKAFTASSEEVCVTYPSHSLTGTAMSVSSACEQLLKMFPSLSRSLCDTLSPGDRVQTKEASFEIFASSPDSEVGAALREIYAGDEKYGRLIASLESGFDASDCRLSEGNRKKLFSKDLHLSQTRIDSFRKCKFGYYCKYVLKLRESEKITIEANDLGTYIHYVFQSLIADCMRDDTLPHCSDTTLYHLISRYTDEFAARYLHIDLGGKCPQRVAALFRRVKRNIKYSARNILNELNTTQFRPADLEISVAEDGEIPPASIRLSDGTSILLNGKIDRVDTYERDGVTYIKLTDYKSGTDTFTMRKLDECEGIQLFIYMMSVCENGQNRYPGQIKPAAAYYISVTVPETQLSASAGGQLAEIAERSTTRRGMIVCDDEVVNAVTNGNGGLLRGTGPINLKTVSLVTSEELEQIFVKLKQVLSALGDEMKSGDSSALPLVKDKRPACEYCDYKLICRYEKSIKTEGAEGEDEQKLDT